MNIVVLAGGLSTERNVSFRSGDRIAAALRRKGHKVVMADVFLGISDDRYALAEYFEHDTEVSFDTKDIPNAAPDLDAVIKSRGDDGSNFFGENIIGLCRMADIVFLALHGADGENGKLQAAFDLLGIKYTGSGSLPCALAMDKGLAKQFMSRHGVPVPHGYVISSEGMEDTSVFDKIHFPCIVKPSNGGSSVGVSIVNEPDEYDDALKLAFSYEDEVVVEDFIKGREFAVGVLDGVALPVIEIAPKEGFYDYANKYTAGAADEICPAELDDETTNQMQLYAVAVAEALGLTIYSRMDFILGEDGNMYCLEANTLPGMTDTSLIPQEAAVIGIGYDDLCEEIIQLSLEKYK